MSELSAPKGLLLKADAVAGPFLIEVQQSLTIRPRAPKLVGILSTSSAPSRSYAEFTRKQCIALGVDFVLREVGAAKDAAAFAEGEGVEEAIIEANGDASVDGIMVGSRSRMYNYTIYECDTIFREGILSDLWPSAGLSVLARSYDTSSDLLCRIIICSRWIAMSSPPNYTSLIARV